jgi:hypothetical protein
MKNWRWLCREADLQVKSLKSFTAEPLLEAEMSQICALLWQECGLQVKRVKLPHARTTFQGQK